MHLVALIAAASLGALAVAAIAAPGAAPYSPAATATANTGAALRRIRELNPKVNAVIAVDPTAEAQATALDRAGRHGPLFGMPILIKDNIESAGPLPTTAGSASRSSTMSPIATRRSSRGCAQAGAVILGKTNLSEWANIRSDHSISGWSAVGGQTRNPYALNRNRLRFLERQRRGGGGRNGGRQRSAPRRMARSPAPPRSTAWSGSSRRSGLVSRHRIVPISHSQDTAGPMARTVHDAALVLSAIAGTDPADPATAEADRHRERFRRPPLHRFAARQKDRRAALRRRFLAPTRCSTRHCRCFASRARP